MLCRTTILVGMHGSGMTNALFLRPGSVLFQLMPFKTGMHKRASILSPPYRLTSIYRWWLCFLPGFRAGRERSLSGSFPSYYGRVNSLILVMDDQEWTNDCHQCSVMHWDLLNEQEKANWKQILGNPHSSSLRVRADQLIRQTREDGHHRAASTFTSGSIRRPTSPRRSSRRSSARLCVSARSSPESCARLYR